MLFRIQCLRRRAGELLIEAQIRAAQSIGRCLALLDVLQLANEMMLEFFMQIVCLAYDGVSSVGTKKTNKSNFFHLIM